MLGDPAARAVRAEAQEANGMAAARSAAGRARERARRVRRGRG